MSIPSSDPKDGARQPDAQPQRKDGPQPPLANVLTGEVQDSVDPFDYAETIVRDLALHVGSRLRDFRSDLAAMHSAVVQLPETMKINALGQSLQELRERLAHLTGVVSQQVTRYPEELERVSRTASELMNRLAGLESWVAAARQTVAQGGEGPNLPVPTGGFVGQDQMSVIVSQIHESILRVVGAVRDLQLDVRDLRSDLKALGGGEPLPSTAIAAAPAPEKSPDPGPALAELERRLGRLEMARPPQPVAAPAPVPDMAGLLFGAWNRLAQPSGAEALSQAVEAVLSALAPRLDRLVGPTQLAKGSGLVAVGQGGRPGAALVVLVATEDLCGHGWVLGGQGAEMRVVEPADKPALRTPCWRALLGAAALALKVDATARVLPLLIYGNGQIDALPPRDEVLAYGRRIGAGAAAEQLLLIGASDQSLGGLARPQEALNALIALGA